MKKFDHPNVLPIFGVCLENNLENGLPFIVLPFMSNGDLKSYLTDLRKKSELLVVNQLPEVQLSSITFNFTADRIQNPFTKYSNYVHTYSYVYTQHTVSCKYVYVYVCMYVLQSI